MLQKKFCDVVICVHNSPRHLRWCINSIFKYSDSSLFNVIIVDDLSDHVTKKTIKEFQKKFPNNIQVITNSTNLGYVKSANEGIRNSVSENVVLVNSDVIVTPNWLTKFYDALKKDPSIGLISPLCNNAANLTVKMPPGFDYLQMNDFFEKNSKKLYPDAMTVVGHCLLITRNVIDKIGLFDKIFAPAYTEETDYHFRAINNGFRAVLSDDTYVFHKGEGSHTNRNDLLEKHLKIFYSRWGKQFKKLLAEYDKKDQLGYLRDKKTQMPLIEKFSFKPSYDVVFLLPSLKGGIGGITTVVEIVNGLINSGLKANIAYFGRKKIDVDLIFEPIQYDDQKQFLAFPPQTKILVATEYGTVDVVKKVANSHKILSAYFIQDYEGWFEPNKLLEFVKKTYHKIENKIVVSHWLQTMLMEQDNCDSKVLNVGVSSEDFYQREKIPELVQKLKKNCKIIVVSMLSDNERRGSIFVAQAIKELLNETEDVGFVVTQRSTVNMIDTHDPRIINVGMIDRNEMPNYFSGCDIIIDGSLYHGFGLPGLEGMSCGLAGILTNVNIDYAKNGSNCILVEPKNVSQIKQAILKLRDQPELLSQMKKNARDTATDYSWERLIPNYLEYFRKLIMLYEENKTRPDFGYEKLMSVKNINEIIESKNTSQHPPKLSDELISPKELFRRFVYYSKEDGFIPTLKYSFKWLFK